MKNDIILCSDVINGQGGISEIISLYYKILNSNGINVHVWAYFDGGDNTSGISEEFIYLYNLETMEHEISKLHNPIFIVSTHEIYNHIYSYIKNERIVSFYMSNIITLLKPFSYEPWRFNINDFVNNFSEKDLILFLSRKEAQLFSNISNRNVDYLPAPFEEMEYNKITNINSNEIKIVWTGRIASKAKNSKFIIDLGIEIKKENLNIKIYIYSKIDLNFISQISKNGLSDVIVFMGYCTNKHTMYSDKDFFLLPSKYEGCSMSLKESITFNCFPLITDNSFSSNTFIPADLYIINPKDAIMIIKKCQKDNNYYSKKIAGIRKNLVENNGSKAIESKLFDIIENVNENYERRLIIDNECIDEMDILKNRKVELVKNNKNIEVYESITSQIEYVNTHKTIEEDNEYYSTKGVYPLRITKPPINVDGDLVSAIIVASNRDGLDKTLKSFMETDYQNIEIIVVNNTKKSDEFHNHNIKLSDGCKIVNTFDNLNASKARNMGFENSNGDYVIWFDDGDTVSKNGIAKLVEAQKIERVAVVWGRILFKNQEKEFESKYIPNLKGNFLKYMLYTLKEIPFSHPCTINTLFVSSTIKNIPWDDRYGRHQDKQFISSVFSLYDGFMIPDVVATFEISSYDNLHNKFENLKYKVFDAKEMLIDDFADHIKELNKNTQVDILSSNLEELCLPYLYTSNIKLGELKRKWEKKFNVQLNVNIEERKDV